MSGSGFQARSDIVQGDVYMKVDDLCGSCIVSICLLFEMDVEVSVVLSNAMFRLCKCFILSLVLLFVVL